jgi:hypothetical protein
VVGGVRVCHLVGDRRGGSEPHHAERGSEGLLAQLYRGIRVWGGQPQGAASP